MHKWAQKRINIMVTTTRTKANVILKSIAKGDSRFSHDDEDMNMMTVGRDYLYVYKSDQWKINRLMMIDRKFPCAFIYIITALA